MSLPDPNDVVIVFDWSDLIDTLGEEAIGELTDRQQERLRKVFEEGVCNGWTEVAEIALDIARNEPPEYDTPESGGHFSDTEATLVVRSDDRSSLIRLHITVS